jgi:hypothetical protein
MQQADCKSVGTLIKNNLLTGANVLEKNYSVKFFRKKLHCLVY